MSNWINGNGPQSNIVLSSRIRLARNLRDIPFPSMMSKESKVEMITRIYNQHTKEEIFKNYNFYDMQTTGFIDRYVLVERHFISPNLASQGAIGAALISDDEIVCIMLNEEDHLRIQSILSGLQIKEAWEIAGQMDDKIESKVDYAFDERLGYLTSCPTNVGTGIRASVMIHLPALSLTSNMNKILHAVTQIGMTIRGIYGEGTEFIGNVFQISNQVTLGRSEEDIIENLMGITQQIIDKEKEARSYLLENNRLQLEDKLLRSWGIMTNARVLSDHEAIKLLSDIRLGIDLGMIKGISNNILNEIMVDTNNASLQKHYGTDLSPIEQDIMRAEQIREKLMQ